MEVDVSARKYSSHRGCVCESNQLHFDHVCILEIFTPLGSKNIPLY